MLFLKQIRASGFKSFADLTVMDFNYDMTGVVGPNGSGKSNITDAIRWTLGEQSTKTLRGSKMDDIVFSGNNEKKAADVAEVTLVFNNIHENFSSIKSDIVEITRKFDKNTRESEFYINSNKCKLKDVQSIALEAGLTRSSIAIISQGTVANFTESKPETKREIFDDAAGVSKYKKRKKETLSKLEKATENLTRLEDIAREISRRLPNLERQSKKALEYQQKVNELKNIELYILTKDLRVLSNRIEELRVEKIEYETQIKKLTNEINMSQDEVNLIIDKDAEDNQKLSELNAKFNSLVQKIANLKVRKQKAELKEQENLNTKDQDEYRATLVKKQFDERQISIKSEKDKIAKAEDSLLELKEKYDYYTGKYNEIYKEIETIRTAISRINIQIETIEHRKKTALNSYQDAISAILNNQKQISGVVGVLKTLINVKEEYQIAISVTASGHMNSLVMKTDQDVKKAIEFLKKNTNLGRVTFLPLNTLTPNLINLVQKQLLEKSEGFVGFANELVEYSNDISKAVEYALANIIVVQTYDDAINLAKNTNFRFNIVSLDGQRILPHGAIIGGSTKNANIFAKQNSLNQDNNLDELKNKIDALEQKELTRTKELTEYKTANDNLRDQINDLNGIIRNAKNNLFNWTENLKELSDEHKSLTGKDLFTGIFSRSEESESITLSRQISELEIQRDEVQIEINSISFKRTQSMEKQKEMNSANSLKRSELDELKTHAGSINTEYNVLLQRRITIIDRLSNGYQITEETALTMDVPEIKDEQVARERIIELTTYIQNIGNINMDAIEEYKTEKERFDYYDQQIKDIYDAKEKLESIILDIDIAMESQFKQIIEDVNKALPDVFSKMFGGGYAELIYTDPDNILETGIDIKIFPPGKKITNLNLLSGGEKSLVALSVLFAILKAKPLPLVILDEAEAPLDPVNVERFARYVRHFSDNTQFIIVTHREGTMTQCDSLFGVTMQTKGITKIINVKLVEVKNLH
ncbi:chromosome segregation protein SMC [Mycoplasma capricolum subsp. capripneumoniae]|uniref:chromosome segregation protein SMC n=1 Tax=Mycoplasma capricolum TaxID=2095 RepID=UPI0002F01304|nr:chromosome segregation protein SMC [Mycoplasma capricolum]AOQ22193.1 oxidoreductase [Mycoplasma capricolum subsp. capripneumoniae M1601]QIF40299.1 chromosome segregation protein SMC [Mycoplasma capricolum subsp. capripneumoniae]QIN42436.1 chromosome segregation protein SMC [Mycoplasma capricolum subsp. capripneumoniae]QIN43136.1 chromosome segregation protein SMC [Mycoplasma capricolum subsp. capripneumoniae]QIN43818.1 chromosome segregation protein SMC [Mycoplasma capricolum subsp. capripn